MGIIYNKSNGIFHIKANKTSYILQTLKEGFIAHLYWGKKLSDECGIDSLLLPRATTQLKHDLDNIKWVDSLDVLPQEYPSFGTSDYRAPAFQVQHKDGSTISDLKYSTHRIIKGKPYLTGLPATYAESNDEAETLELELVDNNANLKVILSYTAYENLDVIARSVRFFNMGKNRVKLLRTLSMSIDFNRYDLDFINLQGSWSRERHIERTALFKGTKSVESRRGASSHQQNPFIALCSKNADEDHGEVYGFNLVYSGNFLAYAEVDQFDTTRIGVGINPFDFTWILEEGETFQTPEAVLVYSPYGLGNMSRTYHKLYRTRLCRSKYRDLPRPVLVNNWEATYFDFNSKKIIEMAKTAKELNIELFVLDDGWFGRRDSDNSSLGDWYVNKRKLPGGLEKLAQEINNLDLKFGLWIEPEMISPDSDLYRNHPDWCIHVPGRTRTQIRNQCMLDLSRQDVCDAIIKMISDVLSSAPIAYVKWDFNRNMTEVGSLKLPEEKQRETAHRYILGLYSVMEEITSRFPDILFESCAGGGGRFDPGMLYYMPQVWTSDNTDAVERLKIQYGTSIVYPASTMGAHVSAVPNHQVQRVTSLKMRNDVALSGNYGYELDLTKLSMEEKEIIKKQVKKYKELRQIIQFGEMYRLLSPFEGNETAWMFVKEDKTEAFVAYFRIMAFPNSPLQRLHLKGLNPDFRYSIDEKRQVYGGDLLMYAGLQIPVLNGDFQSVAWRLKAL